MIELKEPVIKVRDERAVRKALVEIQKRNPDGLLVAEEVVREAKKPSSPLHDCGAFNWNVEEAAYQYWLGQARALIRHIHVTMPDDDTESPIPRYVSLRSDRKRPKGGYRDISSVLSSADLLTELEETAKRDINGVLKRFEMLKKFCKRVRSAAGIKPPKKG